jgi:hypothetical protein
MLAHLFGGGTCGEKFVPPPIRSQHQLGGRLYRTGPASGRKSIRHGVGPDVVVGVTDFHARLDGT